MFSLEQRASPGRRICLRLMLALVRLKPSSGRRPGRWPESDVYSPVLYVGPKSGLSLWCCKIYNVNKKYKSVDKISTALIVSLFNLTSNNNWLSFESLLRGNLLKNVVNERIFCPQTKSWFCENRKWFLSLQSSQKCKDLLISKFGAAMSWKFWTLFELGSY